MSFVPVVRLDSEPSSPPETFRFVPALGPFLSLPSSLALPVLSGGYEAWYCPVCETAAELEGTRRMGSLASLGWVGSGISVALLDVAPSDEVDFGFPPFLSFVLFTSSFRPAPCSSCLGAAAVAAAAAETVGGVSSG